MLTAKLIVVAVRARPRSPKTCHCRDPKRAFHPDRHRKGETILGATEVAGRERSEQTWRSSSLPGR